MKRMGAVSVAVLVVSCMQPYEPPRPDQPHAIVKVRRTYDTTAGTHLREAVDIEENYVLRETVAAGVARAPRIGSVLSHPVPATFVVRSSFFHTETRSVQESYQESRTVYRSESYDCSSGYGSNKSYRTCTRSVPHTEYTTKYRWVTKQVEVPDGSCARQLRFFPRADHVYLLQFTYQAHEACDLSCFEQVGNGDGTFSNKPCPAPPVE